MADKLLAKIEKIKPVLIRNSIAQSQKRNYPNEIYRLEGELSDMRFGGLKPYVLKPFLIGLGVLFGGALVVVIASSIVPKPVLYILEFLVGGAPVYLPVLGFLLKLKIEADISRDIKDGKDKLAEIEREYEETEAYIKTNAEVDIPPRFRHEPALNYIVKGLKAREFITLEQALFKCEEAMTRREIPDSYVPL